MTATPELKTYARAARAAARALSAASPGAKNQALLAMAAKLEAQREALYTANQKDLEAAQAAGLPVAKLDRLRLDEKVLQ